MLKVLFVIIVISNFIGCTSTQTASYHYTQKQIEIGDLDFDRSLRVNEYINAFPQDDLAKPKAGENLSLQIDYFSDSLPRSQNTTLVQIALRTRNANSSEKNKKFGMSLVLDNSGSMLDDHKFQDAIIAILAMVSELPEGTEFALVVFSNEAKIVINPTVITRDSRETIKEEIKKIRTDGGTNIEAGLVLGYKVMSQFSKNSQSRLLLLTDGQSNVGITDPQELAKKAKVQYLEGSRISTIGIGHDVDEQLLRTIAEKGRGAYYFVETASTLKNLLRKDISSLMIPIAKDVKVTISGGSNSILKKVYGYDQKVTNNSIVLDIGEMNSDDWRIFIVEVEGHDQPISVEATSTYSTISSHKTMLTKSASKILMFSKQKNAKFNKIVARNSIIFSNAITLIEASKLNKSKQYKEAEEIVNVQLVNLEVARSFDKTPELSKEFDNLNKVKQLLRKNQGLEEIVAQKAEAPTDSSKQLNLLVEMTLKNSVGCVPGPWILLINLLSLVLF